MNITGFIYLIFAGAILVLSFGGLRFLFHDRHKLPPGEPPFFVSLSGGREPDDTRENEFPYERESKSEYFNSGIWNRSMVGPNHDDQNERVHVSFKQS